MEPVVRTVLTTCLGRVSEVIVPDLQQYVPCEEQLATCSVKKSEKQNKSETIFEVACLCRNSNQDSTTVIEVSDPNNFFVAQYKRAELILKNKDQCRLIERTRLFCPDRRYENARWIYPDFKPNQCIEI